MRSITFSDAELLNGLVTQDEKVLREYYAIFYQSIRRFVLSNNGREEDARDLFQDALVVLFQKVRNGNLELTCSLSTYLYSISRYLWLKELNKRKREVHKAVELEEFIDAGSDITQISEYNERMKVYRLYFEKLSTSCKKVLSLFIEGRSIAEITQLMGYSSDQYTRNRRYRCKSWLIDSIKAKLGNELVGYGNNQDN